VNRIYGSGAATGRVARPGLYALSYAAGLSCRRCRVSRSPPTILSAGVGLGSIRSMLSSSQAKRPERSRRRGAVGPGTCPSADPNPAHQILGSATAQWSCTHGSRHSFGRDLIYHRDHVGQRAVARWRRRASHRLLPSGATSPAVYQASHASGWSPTSAFMSANLAGRLAGVDRQWSRYRVDHERVSMRGLPAGPSRNLRGAVIRALLSSCLIRSSVAFWPSHHFWHFLMARASGLSD